MARAEGLERLGIPSHSRARTWTTRLAIGLAIAAVIGGAAYAWTHRTVPTPTYERARIERGEIVATVTATGTLRALNTVDVGAEVSGRVARVLVDFNSPVRRGDVLLELDPDQLRASVLEAEANVSAARAALRIARTSAAEARTVVNRTEALHARELASDVEREQSQAARERADAEVASATARLAVAQAAVTRAEGALQRAVVRSPIDGIVLSRTVEEGQTVAAQFQTPVLFQLAEDLTRMELHVDIDEADVGRVREQQRATFTVDAYPERSFDARITSVRFAPRTVEGVVTYEAVLEVDNGDRLLRPGMTATASIVTDRRAGVLLVPNAALRFVPPATGGPLSRPRSADRQQGPAFWTLESGAPTPHPVRVIATDGTRSEIAGEGVTEGREVLVDVVAPEP
jgi:HlyD family secretion protein